MLNLQIFNLIFWCTSMCYAIRQQLILYTGPNCTGDGLLLQNQQPDVAVHVAPLIISMSQSYSANGLWVAYKNINFAEGFFDAGIASSECSNSLEFRKAKSIRHVGPPDTSTPSVSFFEDDNFGGRVFTITGRAAVLPKFTPKSIFATAGKNWTLFTGKKFDGIATCYIPNTRRWFDFALQINSSYPIWKSVVRDCHLPEVSNILHSFFE